MKKIYSGILVLFFIGGFSQKIAEKLEIATRELLNSPEMLSANMTFYVAKENGQKVYDFQGNKGLSTASTQKIFTAITALDLLGGDYQYTTKMLYTNEGDLVLFSNGDPTLGSWRYEESKPEKIKASILIALKTYGIDKIRGNLIIDDTYFDFQTIPGGWAWNDIGNYYGTGIWGVNWRENQFDINIKGGNFEGEKTEIIGYSYPVENIEWVSEAISYQGNRDRSVIYTAPMSKMAYINGFLPMKKVTKVSGALPNPPLQLGFEIKNWLKENGIDFKGEIITSSQELLNKGQKIVYKGKEIWKYQSPKLEQIVYWFLKKSINFYGESLIKTIGKKKNNEASFISGMKALKAFWQEKNISPAMINFSDGSGLSPQNYASAKAEVQALLWAKQQKWYPIFEESLPIYNQMKMKSGTIKDAKGYAGYHTSKDGEKYIFSVIINNYHGENINEKLFKLLDCLK